MKRERQRERKRGGECGRDSYCHCEREIEVRRDRYTKS